MKHRFIFSLFIALVMCLGSYVGAVAQEEVMTNDEAETVVPDWAKCRERSIDDRGGSPQRRGPRRSRADAHEG